MAEDVMANLTRDAVDARKMGMSYGQYIAWKEQQELQTRKSAVLKHERLPVCACCGEPIAKGGRNRKYCGQTCADKMRYRQQRESIKRRQLKAEQREMEEDHAVQADSV